MRNERAEAAKRKAKLLSEAGRLIAQAAAVDCPHLDEAGRPCGGCAAHAAGVAVGAGVFPAERLPCFLASFQAMYNSVAAKFDLRPVVIVPNVIGEGGDG